VKIVCAWCLHEGKPATLGEKRPEWEWKGDETHGVCSTHLTLLKLHWHEELLREGNPHIDLAAYLREKMASGF
jgi:hypothetical protein